MSRLLRCFHIGTDVQGQLQGTPTTPCQHCNDKGLSATHSTAVLMIKLCFQSTVTTSRSGSLTAGAVRTAGMLCPLGRYDLCDRAIALSNAKWILHSWWLMSRWCPPSSNEYHGAHHSLLHGPSCHMQTRGHITHASTHCNHCKHALPLHCAHRYTMRTTGRRRSSSSGSFARCRGQPAHASLAFTARSAVTARSVHGPAPDSR